jgi:DNA polymerase III subunit delta
MRARRTRRPQPYQTGIRLEITYRSGAASALWTAGIQPVYLLHGEEDRLKEEAAAALTGRIVDPDFADFDREALAADSVDAPSVLAAAGQAPFGSERRLVIVRGVEQWRDRGRQAEADRLAEGLASLPATACVVLIVKSGEDEGRRKTAVSAKLDAAAKKLGALVICPALKGEGLADWVIARARNEGKRIAPDAVQALIAAVGSEMRPLEMEIAKLVCYVGDRDAITERDVATVVSAGPEDVMFATIDAICRRQTDRALLLLAELHRHDPKPQAVAGKLLALLARQYRMLWQAKFLAEQRVSPRDVRALPPELAAELPSESNIAQLAFKAADLFALSRAYSWEAITGALEKLLLCDLANKGGVTDETGAFGTDPAANLQLLVLDLSGATQPRRQ